MQTSQASVASEAPSDTEKWDLIEIKEEPEDYEEMDSDLDDDDDPNSEESQEENENNDESEEEEESEDETPFVFNGDTTTANEPSDVSLICFFIRIESNNCTFRKNYNETIFLLFLSTWTKCSMTWKIWLVT